MDETYIAERAQGQACGEHTERSTKAKTAVVGTGQRGDKVKAKRMGSLNHKVLQDHVGEHVEKGAITSTDEALKNKKNPKLPGEVEPFVDRILRYKPSKGRAKKDTEVGRP